MTKLKIVSSAVLSALMLCVALPFSANAQSDNSAALMVKAELEKASSAAAAGKVRDLFQDPGTPVLGNPDGDVTIIEFFDYQCPYCKAAETRIMDLLESDGNIRLVIKDFPILGPDSRAAARAALASRKQGKYEDFHKALMGHRGQLKTETMFKIAKSVGLDMDRLRKDMDDPEIADQIMENFNLARSLKVSVTPGFFVETNVLSGVSALTSTAKIDFGAEVAKARASR
jgi:protein-disulfide isomerase